MSSNQKSRSSASPRRPYNPKKDKTAQKNATQKSGFFTRRKDTKRKEKPFKEKAPKVTPVSMAAPPQSSAPKPKLGFRKSSDTQDRQSKKKFFKRGSKASQAAGKKDVQRPAAHKVAADARKRKNKWLIALFSVVGLVALGLIVYLVLSYTSTFKIQNVQVEPTEHITQEEIDKFVVIDPEATLLNVDTVKIVEELKNNPWVESVDIHKQYPDTLNIQINERKIFALTLIGPENAAWFIGQDFHWIEPAKIETKKDEPIREAALRMAKDNAYYLVYDLAGEINPEPGALVDIPILQDVKKISTDLSETLRSQILAFSAPARDSISLRLSNGIEVAFGAADDIANKEKVINAILEQHPNQVTYINVRNPEKPTYRKIDVK